MRVLMTADAVGGVWTYVVTLARALGRFDTQITLAIMGPPPSEAQVAEALKVPGLRLEYGSYRLEWMPDGLHDLDAAGRWLLDLEGGEAPDIIHVNGYALAALPFERPCISIAHSCLLTWWRAVRRQDPPADFARYRDAVRTGLEAATAVVAPSHAMREALIDAYDLDERPVGVIHNGSEVPVNGTHAKEPLVFSAGRFWDEAKNLALLDRAAAYVTWRIAVAGAEESDGGTMQPLGRLDRSAVLAWLERAAIFALPARYEPFGLSPLEAARQGCALVLGDIPSLREIWGDAAAFVDPDDPRALADAINALASNPDRLARMADAARQRSTIYSAERTAAAYHDLYMQLSSDTPVYTPLPDGMYGAGPRCAS